MPVDGPAAGATGSGARRAALVTFLVLVAFGLVLLFVPELATELDRLSAGGSETSPEAVSVTVARRTTETKSAADAGASSDKTSRASAPNPRRRGRTRPGREGRTQIETRSERDSESSTQSTTTTTEPTTPAPDDGVISRAFALPGVPVLLRSTVVALLAGAVAAVILGLGRRSNSPGSAPHEIGAEGASHGGVDSGVPRIPLVTVNEAEAARERIVGGIPLLREIFEARGEPDIDNTLPDMRARVNLTDSLTKEQPLPVSLFASDARVGLAALRTELDQRLRRLARDAEVQSASSIEVILRRLTEEGLFEPEAAAGFRSLLTMSERALHSSSVDPAMAGWVKDRGVALLLSLDLMLPS